MKRIIFSVLILLAIAVPVAIMQGAPARPTPVASPTDGGPFIDSGSPFSDSMPTNDGGTPGLGDAGGPITPGGGDGGMPGPGSGSNLPGAPTNPAPGPGTPSPSPSPSPTPPSPRVPLH